MIRVEAEKARSQWSYALFQIAQTQGKDSPMYKMLGSVAWGRYEYEPCPQETKENILLGLGFLQGVHYAAMQASKQFNVPGLYDLQRIHDKL